MHWIGDYIKVPKFKFETLDIADLVLQPGDFLFFWKMWQDTIIGPLENLFKLFLILSGEGSGMSGACFPLV